MRRRTTIELDEDLVNAAVALTGATLRATVEAALRALVAAAEESMGEQRRRVEEHMARAATRVAPEVLRSDEAWR